MKFTKNIWVKRIPLYIICTVFTVIGVVFLTTSQPLFVKILGGALVLLFGVGGLFAFVKDLRMMISGSVPVGGYPKGLWINRQFILWDDITEFRIGKDADRKKVIHVVTKNALDEIQSHRNPLTRMVLNMKYKQDGALYTIAYEDFSGEAEDFLKYLEEEKKRYGKE